MRYRVYDDRTNDTLFKSDNKLECALFIQENISEDSDDFDHVWIENESLDETIRALEKELAELEGEGA